MDPRHAHPQQHDAAPPEPRGPLAMPVIDMVLPELQLPSQPFRHMAVQEEVEEAARREAAIAAQRERERAARQAARPAPAPTPVVIEDSQTLRDGGDYLPIRTLQEFHIAVNDRRRAPRGPDRRSEPRAYASPWMATPVDGTVDPRPAEVPLEDEPRIIRPLDTIVPKIPLEPSAADEVAGALAPAAPAAQPAVAAGEQLAPVVASQPVAPVAAGSDPLGGIFGAPHAVRIAVINPNAWFPAGQAAAPGLSPTPHADALASQVAAPAAVEPPAAAPTPPPAQAAPWADARPAAPASRGASPWADVAPAAPVAASAPAPAPQQPMAAPAARPAAVTSPATIETAPAAPPPSRLSHDVAEAVRLQPLDAARTGAAQARSGSMAVRIFWLVAVPAAAGIGLGYLLSFVLPS